jgi:hypothetical protein
MADGEKARAVGFLAEIGLAVARQPGAVARDVESGAVGGYGWKQRRQERQGNVGGSHGDTWRKHKAGIAASYISPG